ncbi:MAG: hypothetical protein HOA66_07575 [Candidatus Marinimicrobia bacterium]|jgi:hypothetical protein|nr:hypothetical protein [Candidatus Neomarinimicrobiota bacterium]
MRFYKFLFTIVIVALLSTCAEKPTEVTTLGIIYGVVNDESNNNPLSGATVNIPEIGNRTTSTNGAYEIDELEEGVYSVTASKVGYVSVTEQIEAISNKNKEVNFYLGAAQPAQLLVSPQSLNFGQTVTSLQLTVDNGGDDELSWQVSSDQSWLTIFPTTGATTSETDEVTVSVNRSLLDVGNYTGNLSFASNGGDFSVPVSMEVTPVGLIVSTSTLDFVETESQISFTISNSGTSELIWDLSIEDSWVSTNLTSGTVTTNTETIMVNVNRSGLSPNTYTSSISIQSNGGNQTLTIIMIVPDGPSPTLSINPTNLDFGYTDTQLSFIISNIGEESLNWSISSNQSWISLWPNSGLTTTEDDEILVNVDRTDLLFGAHSGNLDITSDGGNEVVSINLSIPFFEDFSNLDNWSNDGWYISEGTTNCGLCCKTIPCARGPGTMSIDVDVIEGQTLSVYKYGSQGQYLYVYFNNVLMYESGPYDSGDGTINLPISGSGTLNIEFTSSGGLFIDDVSIQ